MLVTRTPPTQLKNCRCHFKICTKKSDNWPMMSFIHSVSEIRIYRVSSGNKLDRIDRQLASYKTAQHNSLVKNVLMSFDGDANVFSNSELIYSQQLPQIEDYSWVLLSQANHVLSYLTRAPLHDNVKTNFQTIESYQKQSFRCVLRKRCSENMQQIYRRTPLPKCNFNKVALHQCQSVISIKLFCSFIEIALRLRCSPVNLPHYFRTPFPKNTSEGLLLSY